MVSYTPNQKIQHDHSIIVYIYNVGIYNKVYIARVKVKHKEVTLMYSCYVEVVFHFVAKVILFLCFFRF